VAPLIPPHVKFWGETSECCTDSCRVDMTHVRQSRPDSGLVFQVKVLKSFQVVPLRSVEVQILALSSGKRP